MDLNFDGLIKRGDRVAVAISGGKDSVALFDAMIKREAELGIEVLALNVEHGIRGESSVRDSEFVKKLCDNARKRALFYKVDALSRAEERGETVEQAARELRYECFFRAIESGFCDKVATAHHADDNAETMLLNIFRGCGTRGLCGIPREAYGGRVIRPMLNVTKEEIAAYIAQNRLIFVEDETNADDGYNRNYIRHNIMPLIGERYPEYRRGLIRLAAIATDENKILDDLAGEMVVCGDDVRITLMGEKMPLLPRAAVLALKAAGLTKDYEAVHVKDVCMLADKSAGASIDLPHGLRAVRGYGDIIICRAGSGEEFCFPFSQGEFDLPRGVLRIKKEDYPTGAKTEKVAFFAKEKANSVLYVCADERILGAVIRNRRTGDVIRKFGGGSVSLKEFLIDKKIERGIRDDLPICALGGEVVFVAGVEVSAAFAAREGLPVYRIEWTRKGEVKGHV